MSETMHLAYVDFERFRFQGKLDLVVRMVAGIAGDTKALKESGVVRVVEKSGRN